MNDGVEYAELHALSNFSFLRGASHPAELVQRAHELGYRALALTDECSMAGVVRAHEALRDLPPDHGLQLIIGSEFHAAGLHLVLLAPTRTAYGQVCSLITRARRRSAKGRYQLAREDFESGLDECLALWVPPGGTCDAVSHSTADHLAAHSQTAGCSTAADNAAPYPWPASRQAAWLRDFFPGRAWIAVELHRGADDAQHLQTLQTLGRHSSLPCVAAGDVHMHRRSRRRLQDVLTAIRHGCSVAEAGARLFPNGERRLRTLAELQRLYPLELLQASADIAARCRFSLAELRYEYPDELVPAGMTATEHLRQLTLQGLRRHWPQSIPPRVQAMVDKELGLIAELRYEHFFLTVHDVVCEAKRRGILCQGRGSAANSVVCYALGITAISPERIEVLFERFISRERAEPPDIDVDFEHERREEIIQYIYDKYGRERTALAATVIMYRTRSAIRDVGKALGLAAADIEHIGRLHTWWDKPGLLHERLRDAGIALDAQTAQRFIDLVAELIGFPRHLSQHVGGFVISGGPLSALVPVENAAMADRTVIQWDKDDLETLGLLKVDVLALGMLTAIRRCFDLVQRHRGITLTLDGIEEGDEATYDMICRADTIGVFQIESRAQMSMLPRLRPRCYYDLVIEVAIVRPGPIQGGMVHPYLKHRRLPPEAVPYPDLKLREVLKRTLGVPIFQEQVMQIAVVAAGFTPGEADGLRRAMAAWRRSGHVDQYRDRLLTGMMRNGYQREFAEQIYRQILGFGDYGFPESHAASFALLTYVSSWLKCHEPAAFIAALMNSQPMGFYQPAQLVQEARRSGVQVLPPDALVSDWDCTLECIDAPAGASGPPVPATAASAGTQAHARSNAAGNTPAAARSPPGTTPRDVLAIRLGLCQVRGLSEGEVQRLVAARERYARDGRHFAGIDELAAASGMARRSVQRLAAAGALRSLAPHRHVASWQALGVEHLPGLVAGLSAPEEPPPLRAPSEREEIWADYRHLRLTTGRHPLALLRPMLERRRIHNSRELRHIGNGATVDVGGLITHMQRPQTAAGVTFISLEDETGIINVIVQPQVFDAGRQAALEASLLLVRGILQNAQGVVHVLARRLHDASRWLNGMERNSRDFR